MLAPVKEVARLLNRKNIGEPKRVVRIELTCMLLVHTYKCILSLYFI